MSNDRKRGLAEWLADLFNRDSFETVEERPDGSFINRTRSPSGESTSPAWEPGERVVASFPKPRPDEPSH